MARPTRRPQRKPRRARPRTRVLRPRTVVGVSGPKLDAYDKVTGHARYVDDLRVPGMLHGDDNIFKQIEITRGDLAAGFAGADETVVGEYHTGHQEQLYIENNGMIAERTAGGGLTVRGSLQCPYYVHKALMRMFGLPEDQVRVIQTVTGGGFGGKEEYPSMIGGHAALLAWKSGRPVKIMYDRLEDIAATTQRPPCGSRIPPGGRGRGPLAPPGMGI